MALSQIQWPLSLPQRPLQEGYSEAPGWDVVSSDFDTGMTRQRKRSSAAMLERRPTYLLRGAQKQDFDAFVELAQGRSFWWPDAGSGMVMRYVRIMEKPAISAKAPNVWTVQLVLSVWPYVTKASEGGE